MLAAQTAAVGVAADGESVMGVAVAGEAEGQACRGCGPVNTISAGRTGGIMDGGDRSILTAAWL